MKKTATWKMVAMITLSIAMVLVAACSKSNNSASESPSGSPSASASETGGASASSSASPSAAEQIDPLGKYDPPITVTSVRVAATTMKFENGDTIDKNAWIKLYEDNLGIQVKYDWTVPDLASYDQKLTVSIASGSLPDIMVVNRTQFQELSENGLLADLTEVYEKYSSEETKKVLNTDGGAALKASSYQGKLYGIPIMPGHPDSAHLLWVRTDWLNKLNLPEPKTMEDLFAISEAFTTKDPDGNGKNDTYGMAITKTLYQDGYALKGFFNSYHAYPQNWVNDASGNLVYGSVQPEMKSALTKLSEMYKSGQLDKEFGVKDGAKVDQDITSGKVGIVYGAMWLPLGGGMLNGKKLNAEMDWLPYPLPSIDDKPAQPAINSGVDSIYVVKKDSKYPEALIKLTNQFLDIQTKRDKETTEAYGSKVDIEKWKYAVVYNNAETNIEKYLQLVKILPEQSPDLDKVSINAKTIYEGIKKGDANGWALERVFAAKSSEELLYNYQQSNQFVSNGFYGPATAAMVSQKPALDKLELEEFTKIIMGASPPDAFDKFVETWKKLGGDQITQEVNEWKNKQ